MKQEIFLIDTNSLITPFLTYYSFDFTPKFWIQLEANIKNGRIAILDMVENEITARNDRLSEWMKAINITNYINHVNEDIIAKYSEVLQCLQNDPCYKSSALFEWSRETVADPWLIATAAIYGYTIITFETLNKGLNPKQPSKTAKIPNVASNFDVTTQNLYYLMQSLKITL